MKAPEKRAVVKAGCLGPSITAGSRAHPTAARDRNDLSVSLLVPFSISPALREDPPERTRRLPYPHKREPTSSPTSSLRRKAPRKPTAMSARSRNPATINRDHLEQAHEIMSEYRSCPSLLTGLPTPDAVNHRLEDCALGGKSAVFFRCACAMAIKCNSTVGTARPAPSGLGAAKYDSSCDVFWTHRQRFDSSTAHQRPKRRTAPVGRSRALGPRSSGVGQRALIERKWPLPDFG